MIEGLDETEADRVRDIEDEGDCPDYRLGGDCGRARAGHDHGCTALDQLACKRLQIFDSSICPAKFNDDVLAIDVSDFIQPLTKRRYLPRIGIGRSGIEKTDDGQRLLRARRERPGCRAAEERDDFASSHGVPPSGRSTPYHIALYITANLSGDDRDGSEADIQPGPVPGPLCP